MAEENRPPYPDYGNLSKEVFFKKIVSGLNAGIDLVFYPVERDPPDTGEFPVHKNHRDRRVIFFENITDMRRTSSSISVSLRSTRSP